jgi:hypothetical protein
MADYAGKSVWIESLAPRMLASLSRSASTIDVTDGLPTSYEKQM